MAKKFVRGITGVKDITKQPLSTTNVNDLVSDGKDIYVHRKTQTGEEYFNLTSGTGGTVSGDAIKTIKSSTNALTVAKSGSTVTLGLDTTQLPSGGGSKPVYCKDGTMITSNGTSQVTIGVNPNTVMLRSNFKVTDGSGLLRKFDMASSTTTMDIDSSKLLRHDCLLSASDSGIVVNHVAGSPTSDIALSSEAKTKLEKAGKVDVIENNVGTLNAKVGTLETKVKNLEGSGATGGGSATPTPTVITSPEGTISTTPIDNGYKLDVDKSHVLVHDNLQATDGGGLTVSQNDNHTITNIELSADTKAKLAKVDPLETNLGTLSTKVETVETNVGTLTDKVTALENAGGTVEDPKAIYTLEQYGTGDEDGLLFTRSGHTQMIKIDQTKVLKHGNISIGEKSGLKKMIPGNGNFGLSLSEDFKTNNVEAINVTAPLTLEKTFGTYGNQVTLGVDSTALGGGGNTVIEANITSPNNTLTVTKKANNTTEIDLSADLKTKIDNAKHEALSGISYEPDGGIAGNWTESGDVVMKLDPAVKMKTDMIDSIRDDVSTLKNKVKTLEDAGASGGGSGEATEVKQPLFKTARVNNVKYTMVGIPYGDSNYLGTVTIETVPISTSAPVYLSRTQEFNKYLSTMSFPSAGYLQSGSILLKQESTGQIAVATDNNSNAGKCVGTFTVIVSAM